MRPTPEKLSQCLVSFTSGKFPGEFLKLWFHLLKLPLLKSLSFSLHPDPFKFQEKGWGVCPHCSNRGQDQGDGVHLQWSPSIPLLGPQCVSPHIMNVVCKLVISRRANVVTLLGNYIPQNQSGQGPLPSKTSISRLPWAAPGHMIGKKKFLINKATARFMRGKDLSGNVFPCGWGSLRPTVLL